MGHSNKYEEAYYDGVERLLSCPRKGPFLFELVLELYIWAMLLKDLSDLIVKMDFPFYPFWVRAPSSQKMKKVKVDGVENRRAIEEALGADENDNDDVILSQSQSQTPILRSYLGLIWALIGHSWSRTLPVP